MPLSRLARFGPFAFDLVALELRRNDRRIRLAPQPARVLALLVERPGEIISRDEFRAAIWGDQTFVQFDAGLTFCIKRLRAVLGDDARRPRFIETLPTRGYRFVGDVTLENVQETAATPRITEAVPPPVLIAPEAHIPRRSVITFAALAGALVVAAAVLAWSVLPRWVRGASSAESLVILPLQNVSGNGEQDFLSDGMTDALITRLGQIRGLRVISRTSAMTYRETSKTAPEIARELNVDNIVEGSIQRLGSRVRLNLNLIEAPTDRTVWAETYERDVDELAALQHDAARMIARHLGVAMTPEEQRRLASVPQVSARVYEAYLKGRYFWNRRTKADMKKAVELFEQAVREEPNYAPGFAGLADAHSMMGTYGWEVPADRAWQRALQAAETAIALDPSLADGYTSRANIAVHYEWNWARGEQDYRRALEMNPGYATARHWHGYYLLLTGRPHDGEREMRRALELDPLSPIINANIGFCRYVARDYDAALQHYRQALEMHPHYRLLHGYMGMAYVGQGRYEQAVAEFQNAFDLAGAPSDMAVLAHTYARMGRTAEAKALLAQLLERSKTESVPAYYVALVYVGLGDRDRAFSWLTTAYTERSGPINELGADPMFDSIRGDRRFTALLRRIGLAESTH